MTTYITLVQPQNEPYSFTATFDNELYTCTVPWIWYGERYYLNIYDQNSLLILTRPLNGSPPGVPLGQPGGTGQNLLQGYFFDNTLVYRIAGSTFEIGP